MTGTAKLVYSAITSLDGYTADETGDFGWGAPDAEVLTCINDIERGFDTHLYGRRMYEVMAYWETFDAAAEEPGQRDFAEIWVAADKIVYSRTLGAPASRRTRIEREFDPDAVRQMKQTAVGDLSVGGPDLAAQAMAAGLVDEVHLFVTPVTLGGGTPALPANLRFEVDLLGVNSFRSGVVHLHYRVGGRAAP